MVDKELLEILVCPQCKGSLGYDQEAMELICHSEQLAFPIRDEIPIMLVDEARHLSTT
ncbi:MAG: Trm112 family protein [Magnetococcales bacterium]|nr:Trm112 family protein [Magnetococcales bacterium]